MTKNKGKCKNKSKPNKELKVDQKPENKNNDEIKEKKEKKETNSSPENAKTHMADSDDHTEIVEEEMKDVEVGISTNDDGAESDRSNKNRDEKHSPERINRNFGQFKGKHDRFNKTIESRREPYQLKTRRSEPIKISAQHNRENDNWKNQQRHSSFNDNATRLGKRNSRWDNPDPDPVRRASRNAEYREYEEQYRRTRGVIDYVKTKEIDQDLFLMPKEYSLAHCVAEDMNMGSGIAVQFRREFKKVDELLNQRQQSGGLAILKDHDRFIYYLVTKRHSSGKPTYATLFSSLLALAKHVAENDVKKLAMPRIGCGLDRLEWDHVKHMIEYVFQKFDLDVEIVVCNFLQTEDSPRLRHKNCRIVNVTYPINTIEENTIIVYLSSEDGYVSKEMESLDEKFHFLAEFRASRKRLGDLVIFDKNQSYVLAGCIVKKSNTDHIDFVSFQKCLMEIKKRNDKKYQFEYVGFQAIKDEDNCVNYKIINVLRNTFQFVDVYICWVGEVQQEMSVRDRFSDSFTATKVDNSDKHEERDSSPQKPYRQNSFSLRDKYATERLYYKTEDGGKRSSLSQFGSNKQNDESDINDEPSTSQGRENWENDEKTSTDWWQEDNNVKTSRRSLFESNEQKEQSNEFSQTSVNEAISSASEVSEDWDKDEKREPPTQKSYQQRIFSRSSNKKSSRDSWLTDNYETSRETQFEANQRKINETKWSTKNIIKPSTSQKSTDWQEDSIIHISKKFKKSEYVCDPIRSKSSSSSGFCSQHYYEMDSESSDWNQEYEERSALNSEYQKYQSESKEIYLKKLKERDQSNLPARYAEVCYVSEDFYFHSPMIPKFDISYRIGKLLNYLKKEGSCEVLKGVPDHIFCLIVKKLPISTCQQNVVFRSLQLLREQAQMLQIKTLVFPKMENIKGDSFNWSEVPYMIEFLFRKVPFEVISVSYDKEKYMDYIKKTKEVSLAHVKHPLFQTKSKSLIFYWVSEDGYITQEMRALDRRFRFLTHFQKSVKKMGEIIRYKPNEDFVLYGCVIRKTPQYAIDFDALQKCVESVNASNKEESFSLAAAPAVEDGDEATNYKIVNVLMNCLKQVSISFCWTGNLKEKMPLNRH